MLALVLIFSLNVVAFASPGNGGAVLPPLPLVEPTSIELTYAVAFGSADGGIIFLPMSKVESKFICVYETVVND